MKIQNILALITVPGICLTLTSCSRNAAEVMAEACALIENAAEVLNKATPANAEESADDLVDIADDMADLANYIQENNDTFKQELDAMSDSQREIILAGLLKATITLQKSTEKAIANGAMDNPKLKAAFERLNREFNAMN